jgi:hypothetical protein
MAALPLIALAFAAAWFSADSVLLVPAILNAVVSVWSNGVMANYHAREAEQIPDRVATASLVSTGLAVLLLAGGLLIW